MINAKELKDWLAKLPKDAQVYVDDGGLSLSVLDSEAYLEVGGNDAQYRMFYTCTKCRHSWDDVWHSTVNCKCPKCGREIEPHTVEDYEP
jgi:hypothetical protein